MKTISAAITKYIVSRNAPTAEMAEPRCFVCNYSDDYYGDQVCRVRRDS